MFRDTIELDFVELVRPIKHQPAATTYKIKPPSQKLQDGYQPHALLVIDSLNLNPKDNHTRIFSRNSFAIHANHKMILLKKVSII